MNDSHARSNRPNAYISVEGKSILFIRASQNSTRRAHMGFFVEITYHVLHSPLAHASQWQRTFLPELLQCKA